MFYAGYEEAAASGAAPFAEQGMEDYGVGFGSPGSKEKFFGRDPQNGGGPAAGIFQNSPGLPAFCMP
jgi:hypothetical protein